MKKYNIIAILLFALVSINIGCFKDLNTLPLDPLDVTADLVFEDPTSYKRFLARVYAGLAVSGQEGPSGRADISGIDEGFGQYLRGLFYHAELSTDEALIAWNDATIQDFHAQTWGANDGFIFAFYSRIFYQISICNEFLRETTNERLDARGQTGAIRDQIASYRAEVRFLRALSYWHALDHFRNVPFVTENDVVGSFFPRQTNAQDLFNYIESELLDIENAIAAPRANEYARADRGAVWMLLAKLYLNAEVYIGTPRYAQALEFSEKVLNAGYALEPEYAHLFLTDNHRSNEIIFPVAFDGNNTRTWGGMTFIINASIGGDAIRPQDLGMAGGWAGLRTTRQFFEKFPDDGGGLIADRNLGQTATHPKRFVVGPYQGNAPNNSNALSSPNRNNIFEGHEFFTQPNTAIQFMAGLAPQLPRFGDNGDGRLVNGGAPIVVAEPGLYFIEVNWNTFTYKIEKREWTIDGPGVMGGPYLMTWDPTLNGVKATVEMSGSEFSFVNRIDGATLGDSDGNGILEYNGSHITKIPGAGTYDIVLFTNQPDYGYRINSRSFDRRPMFFTRGQNLDIDNILLFTDGIAVQKFKNISSTGQPGSNATFPDTDFPMFRLADAYLMAAEAIVRNNGDLTRAAQYINAVRQRAFQSAQANISPNQVTLDFIIDERGRELYWECHRRTDLIRFGKFSETDYLWQWKGGVRNGASVPRFRDIYPIPSQDLGANPNLVQNQGY
jgi:hypothetical protein